MTGHHDSPAGDAEDLEGLAGFYRLLSRLWVSELDAEWLEMLVDGSLADVAEELEFPLDGPREEVLEQLAIEYCGLVIGPKNHVPPHQSVWVEGQLHGQTVVSMQQFLEVVREEVDATMSDHLGVQLGVMGIIVESLAESQAMPETGTETGTEKGSDVTELTELARVFFATHIMWITRFLARAGAATDSKFYLRLIAVTSEFLAEEHEVWE